MPDNSPPSRFDQAQFQAAVRKVRSVAGPLPLAMLLLAGFAASLPAQLRDGGIDPRNLGKGDWIYSIQDATNKLGGHISSVTNENSLMLFYKSQGIRYVIVKTGTGATLYNACYGFPQLTANFINTAHTNGIWVFGYNRSFATNVVGEVAIADFVFSRGADGFVWDAEAEWESGIIGTNGPSLAWQQCSTVRSNWPSKFLAHAPFPIISLHSSFPYKEFGYWCDAVMPQIYHFSSSGLKGSPSACINWSDVNWAAWQSSVASLPPTNINGLTVYWTNVIKPILPLQDVYGPTIAGGLICNGTASAHADEDVMEFTDYAAADPHAQTAGGYKGINFWRADLHGAGQWGCIKAATPGSFPGVVNNVVMDDASATAVGSWTAVRVFGATTSTPTYYGATGTDTNCFGTNYLVKGQGSGSAYVQFTPTILVDGQYDVFQWPVYRADASTNVPFQINFSGGSTTVFANQQTNAGNWSLLGRFRFAAGTSGNIRVLDSIPEPAGVAVADGVKLVFVPPTSVPAAPTNLNATATSTSQIKVAWADNATNEINYILARGAVSGGPYTNVVYLPANATNYTDAGLPANTAFYYVVRATNSAGASAASVQAAATTWPTGASAPAISEHPQPQSVPQGSNATFSVSASGTAELKYQWRFGSTPISGATASAYTRTNVQPADAGNYAVVVTNIVGSVTSSPAALSLIVPPAITVQPQSAFAFSGQSAWFNVAASGTAPLSYQWRSAGTNLPGATATSLTLSSVVTNQTGGYFAVVTNAAGAVTSQVATLTAAPAFPVRQVRQLWGLAPGSRPYLTVASLPNERGLAYNPVTRRVVVVSRTSPGHVYVLDADTGADVRELSLGSGLVTGGTYPLLLPGVADDGVVYVGNLSTSAATPQFRLYRWADDGAATTPTVAFSGDPAPGTGQRWGDTLDVRGAGTDTQVILASRSSNVVSVLTTADGTNFTARAVNVSGAAAGAFGLGLAFGASNTLWGKSTSQPLRQIGFNLTAGTSSTLRSHADPVIPNVLAPIGVSAAFNLLGGIYVGTASNHVELYDLTPTNGPPVLLATQPFATDNDNTGTGTGGVDFGEDRVFALGANNGLVALQLLPPPPVLPAVTAQADGSVRVTLSAWPGTRGWLDVSTNLFDWIPLTTFFATNGSVDFVDTSATNGSQRFYRARL